MNPGLIAAGVLVLLVFLVLFNAIKVVREYQRLVVFRLGRVIGDEGPRPGVPDPVRRQGDDRRPA